MSADITLSMEIELGWGNPSGPVLSDDREPETQTLQKLIDICENHSIPFTFDVVGHLFHNSCKGFHPSPHSDDWFDKDPGGDVSTDPQYYAPDLIGEIHGSKVPHEIASHTYSHPRLDSIPNKVIEWEFDKVAEVFQEFGIEPPTSLVPPWHATPSDKLINELGMKTMRVPFPNYEKPNNSGNNRVQNLYALVTRKHPVGDIVVENNVLKTYCTSHPSLTTPLLPKGQRPVNKLFRTVVPISIRQRILLHYLKDGVRRAIEKDSHIHLWTHLWNISNSQQLQVFKMFSEFLEEKRKKGEIEIKTISELSL